MPKTRLSGVPAVALQLIGVWMVGAVGLPLLAGLFLAAIFMGLPVGAVLVIGCLAVAFVGLAGLITITADVSELGATRSRRAIWTVSVLGGGGALWWFAWGLTDAAGLGISSNPLGKSLAGGIPFVLVAAACLRGWPPKVISVTASLALLGTGLIALRQSGPDELTQRLDYANLQRDRVYVVEIPGYRPTDHAYATTLGSSSFMPADPDDVPADRNITVAAYELLVPMAGACGQTAMDSPLAITQCTTEADGLVYRHSELHHGYQVQVGDTTVVIAADPTVDHQLVRTAALSVRPARVDDFPNTPATDLGALYVVDAPGYRGNVMGIPPGVMYEPADHAAGAASVAVTLYVEANTLDDVCVASQCTPDGDGLTYVRREDTHGYVVERGGVNVEAMGGVSVSRDLLRRTALAARLATDEELLRALAPAPSSNPFGSLRTWLRAHT